LKYYQRYGYPDSVAKFEQKLRNAKPFSFWHHYSHEQVEEGLKNITLLEGIVRKNERNPDIAYVSVEGLKIDVIINSVSD